MGKRTKQFGFIWRQFFVSFAFSSLCGLLGGLSSVGARTEFIPVIAVVANEVCNLAEGLVHDCVFDRHEAGRHGMSCDYVDTL